MREQDARAAVVAEARAWVGTPYHHRAKLKGVGVDCAQFVLAVYAACGLVQDFDTGEYPHDWHLHREAERYTAIIERLAAPIEAADAKPGDVILFRFGRTFSHGAIVLDLPNLVHANLREGAVSLTDLSRDRDLIGRPMLGFSFFEGPLWKNRA